MNTREILITHSVAVAIVMLLWLFQLRKRNLFRWTTTGFWAWASLLLYFVLNPFVSALTDDTLDYEVALSIAGGERRAFWIGFVACVGIITFFISYLRTRPHPITWGIAQPLRLTPFVWLFILGCMALALPSLIIYRAGMLGGLPNVTTEQGRFSGNVTGYQYSGHMLLLVPTTFLILSKSTVGHLLGWLSLALYFALSLFDPWGRFLVVSVLITMSLIDVVKRRKNWPRVAFILVAVVVVTLLRVRGHASIESRSAFLDLIEEVPKNVITNLGSSDSAMLATWYLESYTKDTLGGYDYGIPIINYSITGLLPYKYFPWKYTLLDSLRSRQEARIGSELRMMLYGKKSSLLGSFYAEGGLLAVILLSALIGTLMRKMDGMIRADAPPVVLSTGIMWMSLLWMIWGSQDYWALTQLGILTLPTLGLFLLSPKLRRSTTRKTRKTHIPPWTSNDQSVVLLVEKKEG